MNTMKTIVMLASIMVVLVLANSLLSRPAHKNSSAPSAQTRSPGLPLSNSPQNTPPGLSGTKSASTTVRATRVEPAAGPANLWTEPEKNVAAQVGDLCDANLTHAARQAVWDNIRKENKWDEAIAELEQRAKDDPSNAMVPAALGQAYLMKANTLTNVRDQGVLGLKADQSLEQALKLDENNWDARFWKASAMSYWPPVMGKSVEVIEQFLILVRQQEAAAPQPHFAQTYIHLGDEYKKQGQFDYAEQIWRRGMALYPGQADLASRLKSN